MGCGSLSSHCAQGRRSRSSLEIDKKRDSASQPGCHLDYHHHPISIILLLSKTKIFDNNVCKSGRSYKAVGRKDRFVFW
jgi:hypothetical protein